MPALLGATDDDGFDFYLAATKVLLGGVLGRNLLINVTTHVTRANQFGILGFGGDREDGYQPQSEGSVGLFLSDRLIVGGEWRTRPDNLRAFAEKDGFDVYAAWLPHKQLALTAAYVDFGRIVDQADEQACYVSLQLSF